MGSSQSVPNEDAKPTELADRRTKRTFVESSGPSSTIADKGCCCLSRCGRRRCGCLLPADQGPGATRSDDSGPEEDAQVQRVTRLSKRMQNQDSDDHDHGDQTEAKSSFEETPSFCTTFFNPGHGQIYTAGPEPFTANLGSSDPFSLLNAGPPDFVGSDYGKCP